MSPWAPIRSGCRATLSVKVRTSSTIGRNRRMSWLYVADDGIHVVVELPLAEQLAESPILVVDRGRKLGCLREQRVEIVGGRFETRRNLFAAFAERIGQAPQILQVRFGFVDGILHAGHGLAGIVDQRWQTGIPPAIAAAAPRRR